MRSPAKRLWPTLSVICTLAVYGCATFNPRPLDEVPFRERAQTQIDAGVRVTAAVLSAEESKEIFDVPLYDQGIQPIWLEIENTDKETMVFLPISLDPDYFTPLEVAYMNHFTNAETTNSQMDQYFHERGMGLFIPPGGVRSGFVFTNLDEGTKGFNVELVGEGHQVRTFTFFIPVPGLRVDHHEVDWYDLYSKEEMVSYDEEGLRKALESLPCCTTNKAGTEQGDPINLVVIGDLDDVYHAFIRSGWDETETRHGTSSTSAGRYSSASPLYFYGRPQDVALRKARESMHQRSHVRLWLSPVTFGGKPVLVGQISREIGTKPEETGAPKIDPERDEEMTYEIQPDVDEARDYLIQDLWYSHGLVKFSYVKGVGAAPISEPRANLTGDPYFTDGYRAVLWVSSKPIRFTDVEFVKWESPHDPHER